MKNSNPSDEIHLRHRNRRSYNSVRTPIENSAQWRELLAKAKSEDRQADDDVVVSGKKNRRRAELSSVLTPIENSTQWKAAMAGKSVEILRKDSRRRRRRKAADLVSVLTPIENLEQWRSAMAESPAEKNLGYSTAMAGKSVEILRKDDRRRQRRRAAELVSVLTPIENLEQWRSIMAEYPAEKNLEDGAVADQAVDDVSFTDWLHGTNVL